MISKIEAKGILEPYETALCQTVSRSWERYGLDFAPKIAMPYRRGRANIMYELMADEARNRFDGISEVRVIELGQRFLLEIDPLLIRFKKLDPQLRTRNYPTQMSLSFDSQLPLPGILSRERVTVGYCLNALESQLTAIKVVYIRGTEVVWHYNLDKPGTLPAQITTAFMEEKEGDGERLARPKQRAQEEENLSS